MEYKDICDDYVSLVVDALQNVDVEYFEIKQTKTKSTKKRERVFCYELYHQMRKLQKRNKHLDLTINGEINKAGHLVIKENFDPDFVIHRQGSMGDNHAVIEVKTTKNKRGIIKDFETIKCMVHCYNYKIGIFLITGTDIKWFVQEILPKLKDPNLISHETQIYVVCKNDHETKPEIATLHELRCK
jgi:hypothetical protein